MDDPLEVKLSLTVHRLQKLNEAFAALGLGSRCGFDVRTVDPPRRHRAMRMR